MIFAVCWVYTYCNVVKEVKCMSSSAGAGADPVRVSLQSSSLPLAPSISINTDHLTLSVLKIRGSLHTIPVWIDKCYSSLKSNSMPTLYARDTFSIHFHSKVWGQLDFFFYRNWLLFHYLPFLFSINFTFYSSKQDSLIVFNTSNKKKCFFSTRSAY